MKGGVKRKDDNTYQEEDVLGPADPHYRDGNLPLGHERQRADFRMHVVEAGGLICDLASDDRDQRQRENGENNGKSESNNGNPIAPSRWLSGGEPTERGDRRNEQVVAPIFKVSEAF